MESIVEVGFRNVKIIERTEKAVMPGKGVGVAYLANLECTGVTILLVSFWSLVPALKGVRKVSIASRFTMSVLYLAQDQMRTKNLLPRLVNQIVRKMS
jgi:hypothetical protein